MKKLLLLLAMVFCLSSTAFGQEEIGQVQANGLMFKDTIKILAVDDPDIQGITLYVTYYERALSFNDSGRSSISARKVGKISGTPTTKANIYSNRKGWTFKETIVDRFYDAKRNVLVYLAYMDAASSKNSYHQVSVVPLNND